MKIKIVAGILLAALCVAIAVNYWRTDFGSKMIGTVAAPGSDTSSILQAIRVKRVRPSTMRPERIYSDQALPDEIVKAVTTSLERYSPAAQVALAKAYEQCARSMHTDAEIEDKAAKMSIKMDAAQKISGEPAGDGSTAIAVAYAARAKKIRDSCMAIPVDQIAQWHDMLKKLAIDGDPEAVQAFIGSFWQDHLHPTAADENNADYLEDRELARGFLWDALAQGDCNNMALNALARLKFGPVTNYIGFSILGQQGLASLENQGGPRAQIDAERASILAELDRLRNLVPVDQLDDANQAIAYLHRINCSE